MQKKSAKGYTLIEVLAALAIFIVIVAIISATFTQMLKNIDIVKQKEERLTEIQAMLTILQFDLSQTISKTDLQGPNRQPKGSFYTQNSILHFERTGNINPEFILQRSTLQSIEYFIKNEQLIKRFKNDGENSFKEQVLLSGVQAFEWIFWDNNKGQYTNWPPTNDWAYLTPMAVKLNITLNDYGTIEKIIDMGHHE